MTEDDLGDARVGAMDERSGSGPPMAEGVCVPGRFSCGVETDGQRTVIAVQGELDSQAAADFRRFIDGTRLGAETVVDLSGLEFIDSDGLACLFRLQQRVADAGGLLIGRRPSPTIRRAIQIVQLSRVMALVDDD